MPYYCRKCGAVVTGKFCSCCGTKARSDFQEFRLAERRFERQFREEKYRAHHDPMFSRIACISFDIAFERNVPRGVLFEGVFDSWSNEAWDGLKKAEDEAEGIYQRIVHAVFPEYEHCSSCKE